MTYFFDDTDLFTGLSNSKNKYVSPSISDSSTLKVPDFDKYKNKRLITMPIIMPAPKNIKHK